MVYTKILSSTTVSTLMIIIRNVSWAPNQNIRMISKGSCDTKDWSNDYWKFSLAITWINYILKLKTVILNCNNISQYYCFYCIFNHINAALMSIRFFFPKSFNVKSYQHSNSIMFWKIIVMVPDGNLSLKWFITKWMLPSSKLTLFLNSDNKSY